MKKIFFYLAILVSFTVTAQSKISAPETDSTLVDNTKFVLKQNSGRAYSIRFDSIRNVLKDYFDTLYSGGSSLNVYTENGTIAGGDAEATIGVFDSMNQTGSGFIYRQNYNNSGVTGAFVLSDNLLLSSSTANIFSGTLTGGLILGSDNNKILLGESNGSNTTTGLGLDYSLVTGTKTQSFQDKNGTIALLSDITGASPTIPNDLVLGVQDDTEGTITLHGDDATASGKITLHNGDTDDTEVDNYTIEGSGGSLFIKANGGTEGTAAPIIAIDDSELGVHLPLQSNTIIDNGNDDLAVTKRWVNAQGFGSGGTRLTASIAGSTNLDWSTTNEVFVYTLTGATTIVDTNLPTGTNTRVIQLIITGDEALTLPATWTGLPNNDNYDGTTLNHITVSCINGNTSSELIIYSLTNL